MLIKKIFIKSTLVLFLFVVFETASAQDNSNLYLDLNFDKDKVVASVDSINITAEEFYLSYEFGPAFVKKSRNSREKHLEYMINEKLLALDGYSRDIDTAEEISSLLNEFTNDLATEELFKDSILYNIKINDKELNEIIKKKQIELEIRWLFSKEEKEIRQQYDLIKNGTPFDTLFLKQLNQGIFPDDRTLKTNVFQLEKKNPLLAQQVENLKLHDVSPPQHQEDGWYIITISSIKHNVVTSESEYIRLRQEGVNALTMKESEALSEKFVNDVMVRNNPVIKRDAFKIVRSYLGKFYLPEEKYREWELDKKLDETLISIEDGVDELPLITLQKKNITTSEFLTWFRNRSQYIKFNEKSFADFSISLEKLVWRMVRDNLLSELAKGYNYDNNPAVTKQFSWWKDKILSSAVRNEIVNSVNLESGEVSGAGSKSYSSEEMQSEIQKRMLHKILALRQRYPVKINKDQLDLIPLSVEEDKKAIEFYTIKNKGLIPRTPYPTINHEWVNWE